MKFFIALLSLCAFLFAQEQAAAAPAEKKAVKAKTVEVKGSVVSVDTVAGTLIVKTEKGEDTLVCDKATKIKSLCKKKCTLASIKTGTDVAVKCQEKEGKMCATSITEKKAPAKVPEAAPAVAPAAPAPAPVAPAPAPAAPVPAKK